MAKGEKKVLRLALYKLDRLLADTGFALMPFVRNSPAGHGDPTSVRHPDYEYREAGNNCLKICAVHTPTGKCITIRFEYYTTGPGATLAVYKEPWPIAGANGTRFHEEHVQVPDRERLPPPIYWGDPRPVEMVVEDLALSVHAQLMSHREDR